MNDWEDLQAEWQAYQPDMQKIQKKISWVTWRMRLVLLIDVIFLVCYGYFTVYFVNQYPEDWLQNTWFIVILILSTYAVYWDFKIRLPIFHPQDDSTQAILRFYLNRTKAGIRLGKFGCNFCAVMLLAFWILTSVNYFYVTGNDKLLDPYFLVFGNVWILMFIFFYWQYKRKKQKEYNRLVSLWQEYL